MANKQIDMRDIKKIFKLHTEGVSKRKISSQLGLSRNTVTKYIAFLKRYQLTYDEVLALSIEELHRLFHSQEKSKNERLLTLEGTFPILTKNYVRLELPNNYYGRNIRSVTQMVLCSHSLVTGMQSGVKQFLQ